MLSSAVPHVATLLAELLKGPAEPPPQAVIEPLRRRGGLDRRPSGKRVDDSRDQHAGGAGGNVRSLAIRRGAGAARGLAPIETTDRW